MKTLIERLLGWHLHTWKNKRDRAPGSLVMYVQRSCACGINQEQIRTTYGNLGGWYNV